MRPRLYGGVGRAREKLALTQLSVVDIKVPCAFVGID